MSNDKGIKANGLQKIFEICKKEQIMCKCLELTYRV